MGTEKSLQGLSNEEKIKKCPECGSTEFEYDGGEVYCKKCGLVMD
jgi:uncharacterized Zn finger protein (UPF0148 family)